VLGQSASVVLCDEPTAMLDPIASSSVLGLLQEIAAGGAVVIMVSHDPELIAALADRRLSLSPG
jgi:peptide/nickel transport system ATP-binding protein